MIITPELIPHENFHTGIWLQTVERPSWYYFRKQVNRNDIINPDFMQSVDEPLKELVAFLQKRGIKTTPSCSGHHKSLRSLETIYKELEEDGYFIKNGGVKLKNIETGDEYFYKNENYAQPWTKRDFLQKLMTYQRNGVLGIRAGKLKRIKERLLNLKIRNARVLEKDHVLLFLTESRSQADILGTWQEITRQVKFILMCDGRR